LLQDNFITEFYVSYKFNWVRVRVISVLMPLSVISAVSFIGGGNQSTGVSKFL
jgi:hypothetical protein